MTNRPYNFGAGPSTIPESILQIARDELFDWQGSGTSTLEIGHRTPYFMEMMTKMKADIKKMLAIPDNYRVLFMHGGGQGQFAIVPMNLMGSKTKTDYFNTGVWSGKAVKEAGKYCDVNVALALDESSGLALPSRSDWQLSDDAAYVYYCSNETISGVEFHETPDVDSVPLVCDMTSSIASRPIEVAKHGVIFAGAQKNLGIAGLCMVIVRDDLLEQAMDITPQIFNYGEQAKQSSLCNTPPVFACYMTSLFCDWVIAQGGVSEIEKINIRKAKKLYEVVDASDFYHNNISKGCRSRMNVTFTLADNTLQTAFLDEAKAAGLINLKGHRSVGGIRASIYNAMPEEGVDALVTFMRKFEKSRG